MTNNDYTSPTLWLVTQPDGSHYIAFTASDRAPYRDVMTDEETGEQTDTWMADDGLFILAVATDDLPHYLRSHSWADEPMRMRAAFFPAATGSVTCQRYTSFDRCWRHNFTKNLLACHNCLGSRCKALESYRRTAGQPAAATVNNVFA
jgi:hypothetical protein